MTARDEVVRRLLTKACDVLTCEARVGVGVDVCSVHVDGAAPSDFDVAAAGRRAAAELEGWIALQRPAETES